MRGITVAALTSAALVVAGTSSSAHPTHDGTGKEAGFDLVAESVSPGGVPMDQRITDQRCEDGMAGIFPCHKIDLAAFVPLTEMGSVWSNDIWGWTDPQTKREYALIGLYEGTGFFDVTDASNPTWLGMLPSHVQSGRGIWRDIKVHQDHAYIVSEIVGHGMQVFDLTQLRGVDTAQEWQETAWLGGFGHAHNLAINEETSTAYVVGSYFQLTATAPGCQGNFGGPIIIDLSSPAEPVITGCYGEDGYTHDVQCVVYQGPDATYRGEEICIASNEDTVTILHVEDGAATMVSRVPYATASYTHQGWLTENHEYFLLGDELDEINGTVQSTTTYVWDVRDLDNPVLEGAHTNGNSSIDHNIFIKDGLAYQSNYTSGLRVNDTYKVEQGRLKEAGFFDVYPANDDTVFAGTWSVYPYFESGTVVMTGVEEGLFVLKPRLKSSDPGFRQGAR